MGTGLAMHPHLGVPRFPSSPYDRQSRASTMYNFVGHHQREHDVNARHTGHFVRDPAGPMPAYGFGSSRALGGFNGSSGMGQTMVHAHSPEPRRSPPQASTSPKAAAATPEMQALIASLQQQLSVSRLAHQNHLDSLADIARSWQSGQQGATEAMESVLELLPGHMANELPELSTDSQVLITQIFNWLDKDSSGTIEQSEITHGMNVDSKVSKSIAVMLGSLPPF